MTRETLAKMLEATAGVAEEKGTWEVADEHRVTFYVGQPGQAMSLSDVKSLRLHDGFLEVVMREHGTSVFVSDEDVAGFANRPLKTKEARRAGF